MILSKQLQVLIEISLSQGKDYEDIRNILLKQGFKDDEISDLFSQYRGNSEVLDKKEIVPEENNSAQQRVGKDVEQFLNVGTNTQTAKDLLLKEQSKFQAVPEIKMVSGDYKSVQGQQYINVGFAGMPEIENVLKEESQKKVEKSAAPLVILLIVVLAMIAGFFYWLLVLKDGGAAIINNKVNEQEINTTSDATSTKPDFSSGEVDPFTGELFETE